MNAGSYGSCPRPVFEASQRISESIEANPDGFYRIKLAGMLIDVRTRLAKFINAKEVDDVVMITSATHGINNVLHNVDWQEGDTLIGCECDLLSAE
jgi:selenocysteine lyase/cysteine desulfurase